MISQRRQIAILVFDMFFLTLGFSRTMLGVIGSYSSVGRIAGPPTGGFAYDLSYNLPYLIAGTLAASSALAAAVIARKPPQDSRRLRENI